MAVTGAAVAVSSWAARARVTGDTPEARVASICRLADDRPRGAGDAIAAAAAQEPHADVRRAAMANLVHFVEPKHRPIIEAGTEDDSPSVRAAAAGTLGAYNDDGAAETLKRLLADADEEVRLGALAGLGRIDRPKATAALFLAAERGDNVVVCQRALLTLARRLKISFPEPPDPTKQPQTWRRTLAALRRTPMIRDALAGESGTKQGPPGG